MPAPYNAVTIQRLAAQHISVEPARGHIQVHAISDHPRRGCNRFSVCI